MYEIIGMLSYQTIFALHFGQKERPLLILFPRGVRYVYAPRNDPTAAPKKKSKRRNITSIFKSILIIADN